MSGRNIDSISIFGEYTQKENRLTAALLHILNVGNEPLIRHIVEKLNRELPSNEILITTQQKEDFSIPDGTLECSFKFKIFIESKIKPYPVTMTFSRHVGEILSEYRAKSLSSVPDKYRYYI